MAFIFEEFSQEKILSKPNKDAGVEIKPPARNPEPGPAKHFTGSDYEKFSATLINEVGNALWFGNGAYADKCEHIMASVEALAGIRPQDELEGMLAAQMVACHHAAMDCFRRAMLPNQTFEGRQQNLNFASKLQRSYATHMETLDKHRGKGQQKVTVEHVHVHQGGQAIVGAVEAGVGATAKSQEQAHGKSITHAPEPEMRGAFEADRQTVPQRSDGKR